MYILKYVYVNIYPHLEGTSYKLYNFKRVYVCYHVSYIYMCISMYVRGRISTSPTK